MNEEEFNLPEYNSPRISSEVLDCSLPLTFDQYSVCGFACKYCFSQYIKGRGSGQSDYDNKVIKAVRPEKIRKIFSGELKKSYSTFIKNRMPIQWGGLTDPFCPYEKGFQIGLEILKILNEHNYPCSFSSKGDLILTDERYLNEFKKAGSNWHYKASIITNDEAKAKIIEEHVPSPARRFEVLKKLSSIGVKTTLRLRPFIIGLTDKTLDDLIRNAKKAGCQSVSAEFFCLDLRGLGRKGTRESYRIMSEVLGFDLVEFYKKFNGGRTGYIRLDPKFKRHYAKMLIDTCKKYDIKLCFSDADFKNFCASGSCCGILDENKGLNNYAKFQFTELIRIAKKKGFITFEDALNCNEHIDWRKEVRIEEFMNLVDVQGRARHGNMTYYDFFLKSWNDIKAGISPFKAYGGVLVPKQKDKNGNWIYYYNYEKDKL